jgi:hypothetical protein
MKQRRRNIEKAISILANSAYMAGGNAQTRPGFRRRNRLNRNRSNRIFNELNYASSSKPQSLGVGRSELNIERFVQEASLVSQKYYKIGEILTGSLEFVQKMTTYRYFKIVGLAVIFEPNFNSSPERVYLQVNWDGNETDNMENEDSTKIVPQYRNRRYVYRFIPPNLTVIDNGGYLNYKAWITRTIYNTNTEMPGNIILKASAANNQVNCRIVLRVWFAGSVIQSLSKNLEFANMINPNLLKGEGIEGKSKAMSKPSSDMSNEINSSKVLTGKERTVDPIIEEEPLEKSECECTSESRGVVVPQAPSSGEVFLGNRKAYCSNCQCFLKHFSESQSGLKKTPKSRNNSYPVESRSCKTPFNDGIKQES